MCSCNCKINLQNTSTTINQFAKYNIWMPCLSEHHTWALFHGNAWFQINLGASCAPLHLCGLTTTSVWFNRINRVWLLGTTAHVASGLLTIHTINLINRVSPRETSCPMIKDRCNLTNPRSMLHAQDCHPHKLSIFFRACGACGKELLGRGARQNWR